MANSSTRGTISSATDSQSTHKRALEEWISSLRSRRSSAQRVANGLTDEEHRRRFLPRDGPRFARHLCFHKAKITVDRRTADVQPLAITGAPRDERSALNVQRNSASVPNSVSAMEQETVPRTSALFECCQARNSAICAGFFEKQCHRHRQYLLINFISDARRKSLFYLRKPTVLPAQTRFAIATPLRASHLASMR